jgi:gluconokinase
MAHLERAVVIMGVSGSGKTTLGQALAARLGWPLLDADDYHTPDARARMQRGEGLRDADRAPWLARLHAELQTRPGGVVLACSALRARYRQALGEADGARFVYLRVPVTLLQARLSARQGQHYAGPALLPSQLATLEEPAAAEGALVLDVDEHTTPDVLVAAVVRWLGPWAVGSEP